MRHEDIREIRSTGASETLEEVVAYNIGASIEALTVRDTETNRLIAIVGVAPCGDGAGSIWMHGTSLMVKHPVSFVRRTPAILKHLHRHYPLLTNWADLRNTVHVKWLRWAGFRFLRTSTTFSNDGSPFVEFFRKGE